MDGMQLHEINAAGMPLMPGIIPDAVAAGSTASVRFLTSIAKKGARYIGSWCWAADERWREALTPAARWCCWNRRGW